MHTPAQLPALIAAIASALLSPCAPAQSDPEPQPQRQDARAVSPPPPRPAPAAPPPPGTTYDAQAIRSAVDAGIKHILQMQEGEGESKAEWPYEGVYRVQGRIPIGYRVGGTAICAMALMSRPGFAEDAQADHEQIQAVRRAMEFVATAINHPLMSYTDYDAGYDVRGWGYTYGLQFLLRLEDHKFPTEPERKGLQKAIRFYIDAINRTEIPQVGGWNYARPPGKDKVAPPSPFMTGPTLQALFEAHRLGHAVDPAVITRALDYLEASRAPSGSVSYSGNGNSRPSNGVPGAVGRMLATESTLYLAGRGSQAGVRAAIDAFIVHWGWLEQRRAKPGTHVGPYAVAPYYFYYAHYYAAQAIELLPPAERAEYRRRLSELVFRTRSEEDGSWNDRVFPRSASYGTSMSVMALCMPESPAPAAWKPDAVNPK